MKILIDTHVLLWQLSGSSELSRRASRQLLNAKNELYVSIAGIWEIAIKQSIGKLKLRAGWSELITEELARNRINVIPVSIAHCRALSDLPFHHRDPFDRMIIAQAITEECSLITRDENFHAYPVKVVW